MGGVCYVSKSHRVTVDVAGVCVAEAAIGSAPYGSFARRLTEFMRRARVSETELGRRLGVTRQTIRRWKSGKVQPQEHHFDSLAYALRWRAPDGRIHELEESESSWLRAAAGYT